LDLGPFGGQTVDSARVRTRGERVPFTGVAAAGSPDSLRSITRRTVLCVILQISVAPRPRVASRVTSDSFIALLGARSGTQQVRGNAMLMT
jgi:hypothetical protein